MPKYEVEFWDSTRGVIEVEAENANDAEAEVQRLADEWGDEGLSPHVQQSEFGVTATLIEEDSE